MFEMPKMLETFPQKPLENPPILPPILFYPILSYNILSKLKVGARCQWRRSLAVAGGASLALAHQSCRAGDRWA